MNAQGKMRLKGLILASAVAAALAACGGGSSSTSTNTSSSLTLSGTAATGLAIANSSVSVKCQGGSGTATTKADGTYTVTVAGATLPCALEVTANGETLRSVVSGTGTAATANITPLTELLVAALLQQHPDALADGAPSATAITSDALKAAKDTVISFLQANDIDVTALADTDFVGTPLTAAVTTPGTGDTQDQLLDKLKTALPNLSDAATTIATAPTGCAVAKSGKYTLINHTGAVSFANVDFSKQTISFDDNPTPQAFKASSTYACEFTGGTVTVNFASSGLAIYKDTTTKVIGIALPTQPFDKSVFGDTYNLSGYFVQGAGPASLSNNATGPNAQIGTFKVNTDGSVKVCGNTDYSDTCGITASFSSTLNSDGSVDFLAPDTTTPTKAYSYKAPNGKKLLVLADSETFLIAAKQEAIDTSKIEPNSVWYQVKGYAGYSGGTGSSAWTGATIESGTSVVTDAAAGTIVQHFDDGVTADRTDTYQWNKPWTGMRLRPAVTGVAPARIGMTAIGMGLSTNGSVNIVSSTAVTAPNVPGFTLSVKR